MEKIAMWGGVAGVVIAVFAIVILYLTRSNIIDLLDRDVVMYDKNYEIKKEALHEAFNCLDAVAQNGIEIKNNPQYVQRAKAAYNGLLCTLNSPKLYQEFYRLAVDNMAFGYSAEDIEAFKISCRCELIGKRKHKAEGFKGTTNISGASVSAPVMPQPVQPRPVQPAPPARPAQPKPAQPAPAKPQPKK